MISVTHHSTPHLSLYCLSLLKVPLTSQKIDNAMGLKDLTPGHFTLLSKANPKTVPHSSWLSISQQTTPPPSSTLKLYIYLLVLSFQWFIFFHLCLLQNKKGQKFEDQYYKGASDKIWLVLLFSWLFLTWTGFKS